MTLIYGTTNPVIPVPNSACIYLDLCMEWDRLLGGYYTLRWQADSLSRDKPALEWDLRRHLVCAALVIAVVGPTHAESNGDVIRVVVQRGVDRYDALGRQLYPEYLQYLADHRAEVCAKLGDGCPPVDRMQAMAISMVKTKLGHLMDTGREEMVVELGGDADAKQKSTDIFAAIKEFRSRTWTSNSEGNPMPNVIHNDRIGYDRLWREWLQSLPEVEGKGISTSVEGRSSDLRLKNLDVHPGFVAFLKSKGFEFDEE